MCIKGEPVSTTGEPLASSGGAARLEHPYLLEKKNPSGFAYELLAEAPLDPKMGAEKGENGTLLCPELWSKFSPKKDEFEN